MSKKVAQVYGARWRFEIQFLRVQSGFFRLLRGSVYVSESCDADASLGQSSVVEIQQVIVGI